MDMPNRVYKLSAILDDPRFEGFQSDGHFLQTFPKSRKSRNWKIARVAKEWIVPTLKGRVRLYNDFPCVDWSIPAFSQLAADSLRDLLEPNGELLPIKSQNDGVYYAYNVTTVADVLDIRKSSLKIGSDGITAIGLVDRYEFDTAGVQLLSIFRIPEQPSTIFVSEKFKERVNTGGLKGFNFRIVWPLPEGANWRMIAKVQRQAHESAGLPAGHTVKGNSVIIYLGLPKQSEKPSENTLRSIEKIAKELDVQLVDLSSEAPAIGNLEYIDYDSPGMCRLLLSCPDADSLIEKLRPWLEKLEWPREFKVVTRNRNFADVKTEEKIVLFKK